jgi:phage terminase large subunit
MSSESKVVIELTPRQVEAYLSTRKYLFTLFGGAKGGGKTVGGINILAHDILHHEGGVWAVMRRNYTDLHSTTKASFERFFPKELVISKQAHRWQCVNGNEILWWAADKTRDPNYEKTRGLELTALMFDEGSQGDIELYEVLPTLLRRPAHNISTGAEFHGYIYITTNPVPGQNYLKRIFIDPRTRKTGDGKHHFILSLPDDNPKLPSGYIDRAFGTMSEPMVRMLRHGSWDVDEHDFVIVPNNLIDLVQRTVTDRNPVAAGIDVGLGKPDKTVVVCANQAGEAWVEQELMEYDTMRQVELLRPTLRRIAANNGLSYIDAAAVGKGVADALRAEYGAVVRPVLFSESAEEERSAKTTAKYANRRAQLYYHTREDIISQALRLHPHESLREELTNTCYMQDAGKLQIEPKDAIRERLGRSPDYADALVLCNAARRKRGANALVITPTISTTTRTSNYAGYGY